MDTTQEPVNYEDLTPKQLDFLKDHLDPEKHRKKPDNTPKNLLLTVIWPVMLACIMLEAWAGWPAIFGAIPSVLYGFAGVLLIIGAVSIFAIAPSERSSERMSIRGKSHYWDNIICDINGWVIRYRPQSEAVKQRQKFMKMHHWALPVILFATGHWFVGTLATVGLLAILLAYYGGRNDGLRYLAAIEEQHVLPEEDAEPA